jgi:methylenetetrahydrofolate dehydrogenase (NADP+)/methenyltetrahydrofolate cyclohydrolase
MDPASQVYVRSKGKATVEAGMASSSTLSADTSEADLLALIETLNADPAVDGILVQLPLPAHLDEQKSSRRSAGQDVDGFHVINAGLSVGQPGFVPCTPLGCLMLLKDRWAICPGSDAVVIGRSNIVGKPMAAAARGKLHGDRGAQPHPQPAGRGARADIVVAAVGGPNW